MSLSLVVNGMKNLFYISPIQFQYFIFIEVPVLSNLLAMKNFAKEKNLHMCLLGEILFKWLISGWCENKYIYMYWYVKLQHVDPDIRQTYRQTNEIGLHGLLRCLIIHMLWSLLGSARLCPVPASFGRSATQSLPCYSCHNSRSAAE